MVGCRRPASSLAALGSPGSGTLIPPVGRGQGASAGVGGQGRTRGGPDPGRLVIRRSSRWHRVPSPCHRRGADSRPVTVKSLPTSTVTRCPSGGGQVRLIDAVGVGLHPQHGRAGVPGQRRRPDLAGGVAGEQVLVGPLALGLVHRAAPGRGPGRGGGVGVGRGGGRGGRARRQRSRQHPPPGARRRPGLPCRPNAASRAARCCCPTAASLLVARCRAGRASLPAAPWPDLEAAWQLAGNGSDRPSHHHRAATVRRWT
jgi:hypothetical protein